MEIDTIAKNILKNVNTGEEVELQSFWQDRTTVIIFLRRWGCLFCHMWAKEVSAIAPILKRNNINLIGVGVEELGAKEFSDLKLFDGELFIDTDRKTYNGLGFKRFNLLSVLASLLWKESRNNISKGRKMGLQGNLKGDGLQNGGALVVEKGGKVLRHFVQVGPSEQLSNEEILKLVGLEAEITNIPSESGDSAEKSDKKATVECNSEQCSVPAN